MALETVTHISDLVATNPTSSDPKSEGDNHVRNIKLALKTDFPNVSGVVSASHTELSYVQGVTSSIQPQITAKGAVAGQAWTGTHDFTGATAINVPAATTANNAVSLATAQALLSGGGTPANIPITSLGKGTLTALQVVRLNAAGTALEGTSGAALVYLSTVTASGASTVDIETGFSSTYDEYVIEASGVKTSASLPNIVALLKIAGAYVTTGYDGTFAYEPSTVAGTTLSQSSNAASAVVAIGCNGANDVTGFTVELFDANSAIGKIAKSSGGTASISTSANYSFRSSFNCRSSGVLSGLRLKPTTGTISGTFKLYGIAKS